MAEEHCLSENEAPEEVPLSVGKTQAAKRRKQELAGRSEQSHLAKKQRRDSSRSKIDNHRARDTLGKSATPTETEQDLLSEEIIEALVRENKYAAAAFVAGLLLHMSLAAK